MIKQHKANIRYLNARKFKLSWLPLAMFLAQNVRGRKELKHLLELGFVIDPSDDNVLVNPESQVTLSFIANSKKPRIGRYYFRLGFGLARNIAHAYIESNSIAKSVKLFSRFWRNMGNYAPVTRAELESKLLQLNYQVGYSTNWDETRPGIVFHSNGKWVFEINYYYMTVYEDHPTVAQLIFVSKYWPLLRRLLNRKQLTRSEFVACQ